MPEPLFRRLAIIGVGLIGSSIARIATEKRTLADELVVYDQSVQVLARVKALRIADRVELDIADAVREADCVILCAPVGAYATIAAAIAPHLPAGCGALSRALRL